MERLTRVWWESDESLTKVWWRGDLGQVGEIRKPRGELVKVGCSRSCCTLTNTPTGDAARSSKLVMHWNFDRRCQYSRTHRTSKTLREALWSVETQENRMTTATTKKELCLWSASRKFNNPKSREPLDSEQHTSINVPSITVLSTSNVPQFIEQSGLSFSNCSTIWQDISNKWLVVYFTLPQPWWRRFATIEVITWHNPEFNKYALPLRLGGTKSAA